MVEKDMKYQDLQKLAKEAGINCFGKKKDELKKELEAQGISTTISEDIKVEEKAKAEEPVVVNTVPGLTTEDIADKLEKFMVEQNTVNTSIIDTLKTINNLTGHPRETLPEVEESDLNVENDENKDVAETVKSKTPFEPVEPRIKQAGFNEALQNIDLSSEKLDMNVVEQAEQRGVVAARDIANSIQTKVEIKDVYVADALNHVFGWTTEQIKDSIHTMTRPRYEN